MFVLTQARLGIEASWATKDVGMICRMLRKVSTRIIGLHALCQRNLLNTSFEVNLHYRFPKEIYSEILQSTQRYYTSITRSGLTVVCMNFWFYRMMPSHD